MSHVLREIIAHTGLERQSEPQFVTANYINNPHGVRCVVALDDTGAVGGFQSLIGAYTGNPYWVPEGWGIIGTHISPRLHRQGAGRALFAASHAAAIDARLEKIDAYIGADNMAALRYYDAMGFRTYRQDERIIQKAFDLSSAQPG